jgi:arylsulfatase A-like enzyme
VERVTEEEKPNIVMMVMDTARAESLSCYGNDEKTTPFLDKLAEENVKYERAISQAVWTLPSHASIFTGKYQSEHGANRYNKSFDGLDMVQEDLREEGYNTIGLVNVAYLWPQFGFDQYFDDYEYINKNYISRKGIIEDVDSDASKLGKLKQVIKSAYSKEGLKGVYGLFNYIAKESLLLKDSGAKETNKKALEKVEDSDEPFFMFLNYLEPHGPYTPPFPHSHKYLDNKLRWLSITPWSAFSDFVEKDMRRFYASDKEEDEEELSELKNLYHAELNYLDSQIAKLYKKIKQEHPNTIFIITSDHGEAFGENNHYEHFASLHDQVTRVPLIESYPDGRNETVEGPRESRQLHDHLIELSKGNRGLVAEPEQAITEYYGKDEEEIMNVVETMEMIYPMDQHGVSVQDENLQVIKGFEDKGISRVEKEEDKKKIGLKAEKVLEKLRILGG